VVKRQLAGPLSFAAILTSVFIASEDVSPIKFHLVSGQTVVKQQPNNPRHRNIKIDRGDPIVSIRLEITPELAYLTPALEVIVGISVLLKRDDLGKVAKQQRKCPSGSHYADSHIMLVEDKHITVQPGFELVSNHISYLDSATMSRLIVQRARRPTDASRIQAKYRSAIAASLALNQGT
jgi:hypothetical protein